MRQPPILDIRGLSQRQIAEHVRNALSGSSGDVLRQFLERHCYMLPGPRTEPWEGEERVAFRYGRMTLFQLVEYYETEKLENFPKDTSRQG